MPYIMQCFVKKPKKVEKGLDFDRKLYIARRVFEQSNENTYVVSLSSRTIVYKGMFLVSQLRLFFDDLQDVDYESAIAIVHSRFSTNTQPSWQRAHPNRFIVHNGEINTILGNADKMLAREETMESEQLKGELHKVLPVINASGSDSAMLDNTLEFLVMSGMELPLAVMITIPEPWANNRYISEKKKDFYQYYATMMEPWDGPASILFSDGDLVGAVLDRNGLRPSRYYITDEDELILSSEVGVMPISEEHVIKKDRLRPGKMLLVDTVKGELVDDDVLKETYASRRPYGEWLDSNLVELKDIHIPNHRVEHYSNEERRKLQKAFGYTYEEVKNSILPMAQNGGEPIAAMGHDTPLPMLSKQPQPLFNYFRQRFAQVTNPPIDAIREEVVTSTSNYIGEDGNLLHMQQHLVRTKKRTSVAMILESAEPREVHHFATLLGYGACAVNPYLALDTIKRLIDCNMLDKDYYAAVDDYNSAILHGIVKIASKMGISTIQSYQGSKIFEAIGISKEVTDVYFTDTVSRIGGISLQDIETQVENLHTRAFDPLDLGNDTTLDSLGMHKSRSGKEDHLYNPITTSNTFR